MQQHHKIWSDEKTRRFRRLLLDWYETHKRQLPWRSKPTPYRVWISEIMLQQTQVRTVLPYYERFLRRFPGIGVLADATEEEVLKYWAGLGYYSRARNLHRAARKIVQDHGGRFPRQLDEILELPGIGRYTAGAIYSIAFNHPQPIVDGNVRRVINRLHGAEKDTPEDFFWRQAESWVPADRPSELNQAVMELGALLCTPIQPACRICPVRILCLAQRKGIQDCIPRPRSMPPVIKVELVMLVIERRGRILATREPGVSFIPGGWGLPLRSVGPGSSPAAAARALARSFTKSPQLRDCGIVGHSITHRRIRTHVFHTEPASVVPRIPGGRYRWLHSQELEGLLMSSLFNKALKCALGGGDPD